MKKTRQMGSYRQNTPPIFQPKQIASLLLLTGLSLAAWAKDKPQTFNIPALPLDSALTELADKATLRLLYQADLVAKLRSQPVSGQYSPEQALKILLGQSGLGFRKTADNAFTVEELPPALQINQADPTTLPKVTVLGNAVYDAKDPYNEDYVLPNATSGTKTDTPIMETPLNVQVISKEVLKDQQVVTINQALSNVSGVSMLSRDNAGGSGGTVFMRGFSTNTFFRNGFRIDNPAGYSAAFQDRQFANVESVEVLKGASAILYGRTEPGGMVNVITKQPLETPYYAASQQFGSYNTYRTTIDSSGPMSDDKSLLYRVNMSYQNQGSFRDGVNTENFFIAPIVKWNISPRTQATLEMEYQHDTNLGNNTGIVPTLNGQLLNIPYNRNYTNPNNMAIQDSYFIGFNWSHQFNDDWSIKHRVQVSKNDMSATSQTSSGVQDLGGKPALTLQTYAGPASSDNYSTGVDLTGHFDTGQLKHTLLLGGDYYRYNLDQLSLFGASYSVNLLNPVQPGALLAAADPAGNYTAQNQVDNYGLYLQDQVKLPFNIHLLGGMRYQYVHEIFNIQYPGFNGPLSPIFTADKITPRAGIVWQPQSWLSVYGNYTQGFGPNYLASPLADGSAVPPSNAEQYEGGLKTEFFDGRLRTTFAYFDLTKTNIPTTNPAFPQYSIVTGEANTHGPEIDIMGQVLPGWNVIANYTNLTAHVTKSNNGDTGSRFYNVPRNMGKVWSTYEVQQGDLKGFKLGGGVTMQDNLVGGFAGAAEPISGYATLSLMSGYSFKLGKAKLSTQLNIDNLLDKHYYTGGYNYSNFNSAPSGYGANYMSFGMPRTLMGSISIQY